MLKQPKILILAAAIVLSSGCTVLNELQNDTNAIATVSTADTPAGQKAATHNSEETDINWLFHYYRLVSTGTGKLQSDEYEKTKVEFSEKRTAKNQWQLAILLSIPSTSFYNAGRSSDLFKELTNNDLEHDPHLNDAAFLMHTLVNEQYRIGKISDTIETQLAETQAANKTLQDQINALKAIEDTLYQRNKAEVKPKP